MIHSLYSNKEIFLRELISNASDAADKLRFEALAEPDLLKEDAALQIRVEYDGAANTISVSDNGIGMSRDELIANLGTIARSGTADFLQNMTGDEQKDARLIGQFGVGFYSAFIALTKYVSKPGGLVCPRPRRCAGSLTVKVSSALKISSANNAGHQLPCTSRMRRKSLPMDSGSRA